MDLFIKAMLLVFPYGVSQKLIVQQQLWEKMLYLNLKQKPKRMFYKTKKYVYVPRKNYKLLK
jgi:hypothetical protein